MKKFSGFSKERWSLTALSLAGNNSQSSGTIPVSIEENQQSEGTDKDSSRALNLQETLGINSFLFGVVRSSPRKVTRYAAGIAIGVSVLLWHTPSIASLLVALHMIDPYVAAMLCATSEIMRRIVVFSSSQLCILLS